MTLVSIESIVVGESNDIRSIFVVVRVHRRRDQSLFLEKTLEIATAIATLPDQTRPDLARLDSARLDPSHAVSSRGAKLRSTPGRDGNSYAARFDSVINKWLSALRRPFVLIVNSGRQKLKIALTTINVTAA